MEKKTSFVSEMSAMKDSLSNSFSRMSTRQKRRNKKLRRQTGTIDVSYATDYYPSPQATSSSRLSELSEPEVLSDRIHDFEDDLSETISAATRSGSIETIDRLSVLSDSVPELLDADSFSQMSVARDSDGPPPPPPSVAEVNNDVNGWRVIPIEIVPSTEIVIHRCDETRRCDESVNMQCDELSPETSPNTSSSSVISEKSKSISPVVQSEVDPVEVVILSSHDETSKMDVEDIVPVVVVNNNKSVVSMSVPVTPMSEGKKRHKKSKLSSPATTLLEKSASWLSSLSGSKVTGSGHKDKKQIKSQRTKKSLTSLFEAVASSASSSNNNNSMSQKTKMSLSSTLPADLNKTNRTNSSPDKFIGLAKADSDQMFMTPVKTASASSLSLTDLSGDNLDITSSLRRPKTENHHHHHHPSPNPDGYYTVDSRHLTSSNHSRKSLADKKLLIGVKQFNLDPKKGLEVLDKAGFLDSANPEEVATFLYREGRLSKKQIGAFIGDHRELNKEVLKKFVSMHEFMNLILVQALRQFLWSFRLPGEAMQIDRIMEAFAAHYCDQNPNLFDEPDTCYILSFSIIMLNTALHNPNVRQKITLEQFVAQNRGINSGKDLPKDILELIYRNIKDEPFKIPNESYDDLMYTFFSPEKEGWLLKQGGNWKSWKRRWFVLSDRCLYYFEHTTENIPKGIIPLENVKVRVVDEKDDRNFCFEVYSDSNSFVKGCKTDSRGTVVQGHHKTYRMSASSAEERDLWLDAIRDSIKEHPFYDIITTKKAALRRKSIRHGTQHDIPSSSSMTMTSVTVQSTTTEPTPLSYCAQT